MNVSTGTDLYATYVESAYLVAKNFSLKEKAEADTSDTADTESESESEEDGEASDYLVRIGGGEDAGEHLFLFAGHGKTSFPNRKREQITGRFRSRAPPFCSS